MTAVYFFEIRYEDGYKTFIMAKNIDHALNLAKQFRSKEAVLVKRDVRIYCVEM
jgi:hypothetical protein